MVTPAARIRLFNAASLFSLTLGLVARAIALGSRTPLLGLLAIRLRLRLTIRPASAQAPDTADSRCSASSGSLPTIAPTFSGPRTPSSI
jgi:hypothetical protein